LKNGIPEDIGEGDVCVIVSPSVRQDYLAAQKIASDGVAGAVVLVNGLAKVSSWQMLKKMGSGPCF
jgi:hypothetical protein